MFPSISAVLVLFVFYRTRELKVNGGTPYESGIEVDPALTTKRLYLHF